MRRSISGRAKKTKLHNSPHLVALFSKGMTTRDIPDTMQELNEVKVSHDLVSQVTKTVQSEVTALPSRPLDKVYPILFMDGLVVSIRAEGKILKYTIYLPMAINLEGKKELLGLWISKTDDKKNLISVNRAFNPTFAVPFFGGNLFCHVLAVAGELAKDADVLELYSS